MNEVSRNIIFILELFDYVNESIGLKASARNVYGNRNRVNTALNPLAHHFKCLFPDYAVKYADITVVFRNRYKVFRADDSTVALYPAAKRFCTYDFFCSGIILRLEIQDEFIVVNRLFHL